MELKGLPLSEWLKVKKISRKQFAKNIGVSTQTVDGWVRGGNCKKEFHERLLNLGIDINVQQHKCNFNNDANYVSIFKIKHTSDLKEQPKTFTVKTYIQWNNMSIDEFSKKIGVSRDAAKNWFDGGLVKHKFREKLESLNISMDYIDYKKKKSSIDDELGLPKNAKKTVKKDLPEYVLRCVKGYGNTIVSKKFSKEEIVFYFKNEGYDVNVREQNVIKDGKHYVVELIG